MVTDTMVRMAAQQDSQALLAAPVMLLVGALLFVIILLFAVPGLVAGIGLLDLRPLGQGRGHRDFCYSPIQHTCRDSDRNIWALGLAQLGDGRTLSSPFFHASGRFLRSGF